MRVGDGTSRALRSMDPGSVLRLARWLTCAAAAGAVCWLRQRRRAASPAGSMSADGRRQEPPEAPGSAAQTGGASKQDAFAVMMRRSQEIGGPEGWRKRGRSGLKDTPPVAACMYIYTYIYTCICMYVCDLVQSCVRGDRGKVKDMLSAPPHNSYPRTLYLLLALSLSPPF